MIDTLRRHRPLYVLFARAGVLYLLVRALLTAASAGAGADGAGFDNPVGIVILVTLLGVIDLRRRNEKMLWSNLAYSGWHTAGVFAAAGTLGEFLLAFLKGG